MISLRISSARRLSLRDLALCAAAFFAPLHASAADLVVYLTDVFNSRIHKWTHTDGSVSIFRENTGCADGLGVDKDGNVLACEADLHRVTSTDMQGSVTVLAERYDGKLLNSPNDLWIDPKGGIYFSDPPYALHSAHEQGGNHVYYIEPGTRKVLRVTEDLVAPNGVTGTRDGKTLYVADYEDEKTWAYSINADGTLANKRLFATRTSDGIAIDEFGNVYLTDARITVYNPQGIAIQVIELPESPPTNLCFAGKENKTLFVCTIKSVYTLEMNVRGQ